MVGYAGAFLGGVAAVLSPCAALLLPAFFAYAFSGARLLGRTALFYLGTLLTLVPLGLGAGALGSLVTVHRSTLALVGGVLLIVFGVVTALGIRLPIPGVAQRGDPRAQPEDQHQRQHVLRGGRHQRGPVGRQQRQRVLAAEQFDGSFVRREFMRGQ